MPPEPASAKKRKRRAFENKNGCADKITLRSDPESYISFRATYPYGRGGGTYTLEDTPAGSEEHPKARAQN